MSQRSFPFRTDQLMRVALILWIAYFGVLAMIDWLIADRDANVLLYYAVQIAGSLFILGLTFLPWRRAWSEKSMLPLVLALMATLPTITVHFMLRLAPSAPLRSPDGMTLRLTPIFLIGLLLTAWRYRWPHVVLFSLGIALLNLGYVVVPTLLRGNLPRADSGALLVTGIQTTSLLMVGYITSALVSRLKAQQRSLEEANAQLRDYASTQIELTISHERNRMARELHDTLAHTLSGLTVQLQTVKAYAEIEPATSQQLLDDALMATRDGLQETRGALKSLRATPLEDLGLPLAIRQLAEEAAARANLEIDLRIAEPLPTLAPEVSHAIYRVAQEAIMNVIYHANAKKLTVQITTCTPTTTDEETIQLTVQDDGSGFDTNRKYHNHWGVEGMRERTQLVHGQLIIESQNDHGTTIQLTVPGREI